MDVVIGADSVYSIIAPKIRTAYSQVIYLNIHREIENYMKLWTVDEN